MWGRASISSAVAIALLSLPAFASHPRKIEFRPTVGATRYLCEDDTFFAPKGSVLILDERQGFVTATTWSAGRIPICRHEGGGYQTLIVFETGTKARISIRRFTNPQSFFRVAGRGWKVGMNPLKEILVNIVGTEFNVTQSDDVLRVGMDGGTVTVRSGGVDATVGIGKGADLRPGQAPALFQVDYSLRVTNLQVRQEFNENVVTGNVAPGNAVEGAVMKGDLFTLKTDQPFIVVQNANGVGRVIWLPRSVRPFFGH
jgi:hypothetical protein